MLPLKDNIPTVRRPYVTYALILTNLLVWIVYEHAGGQPGFDDSVTSSGYFPCDIGGSCQPPGHPWFVTAVTAMFLHAGWVHLLGNMDVFLDDLAGSHGGLVAAKVEKGATIAPGESGTVTVSLRLPDRLQAGGRYSGAWETGGIRIPVRIAVPQAKRTRKAAAR